MASERERSGRHLISTKDPITGLPAGSQFRAAVHELLTRARSSHGPFTLLLTRLTEFNAIQEALGPDLADLLLIQFARRLEQCIRAGDQLSRLRGDLFGILLKGRLDGSEVDVIIRGIQRATSVPFELDEQTFTMQVCVGVAPGQKRYSDEREVLRAAAVALGAARKQGGSGQAVFRSGMLVQAEDRYLLRKELRSALDCGALVLHYQPILSLEEGLIVGMEGLIRWNHPVRGWMPAPLIIGLAIEEGILEAVGYWVMYRACRDLAGWNRETPLTRQLTLHINLAAEQIRHPTLIGQIDGVVEKTGVDPGQLCFEVTETSLIGNLDLAKQLLDDLVRRSIQVSLDDFGTGYSSLTYLHQLPFDTIKIDRSFTMVVGEPASARKVALIRTIIALAQSLEMEVIAEGVETEHQRLFYLTEGCTFGQGYLFSRPVAADAALALVLTHRHRAR